MAKKQKWWKGVLLALLITIGGWAIFQVVMLLIEKPFVRWGIIDPIWQNLILVVIVIILMVVGWGTGLKEAVKKLVQ